MNRFKVNIAVVGGRGVGRTSLVNRYIKGEFDNKEYNPIDESINVMYRTIQIEGHVVELQVCDILYDNNFKPKSKDFDIAFVLHDDSHKEITDKIFEMIESLDTPPQSNRYLVITKTDLEESFHKQKAPNIDRFKLQYRFAKVCFVSSLTGDGVDELFISAVAKSLKSKEPEQCFSDKKQKNKCVVM
ncbi:hypothetical protein CL6EHI_006120 [Entamoeba histolytica]|nr:hypothetical protein CL6EHI_006120 [Entamoeba histolytica]